MDGRVVYRAIQQQPAPRPAVVFITGYAVGGVLPFVTPMEPVPVSPSITRTRCAKRNTTAGGCCLQTWPPDPAREPPRKGTLWTVSPNLRPASPRSRTWAYPRIGDVPWNRILREELGAVLLGVRRTGAGLSAARTAMTAG